MPHEPPPVAFEVDPRVTQSNKRAFLIAYALQGNLSRAAAALKMARTTHYLWLQTDPIYAEAYLHAHQHAGDALEEVARLRAIAGSDVLLIFLLKGMKPEKFRERHELTGAGGSALVPASYHVSYHKDMEPPPEADIPPELREKKKADEPDKT